MANRRIFTSQNNYSGIEEVRESVFTDENDVVKYVVVIVLADPAIISDEEEGNNDYLKYSIPARDVPASIEIIPRHAGYADQGTIHGLELRRADLKRYLGILLLPVYYELPTERAYCILDKDFVAPLVVNWMSRNIFLDICHSRVCWNYELCQKIRTLSDLASENFIPEYAHCTHLSTAL